MMGDVDFLSALPHQAEHLAGVLFQFANADCPHGHLLFVVTNVDTIISSGGRRSQ
jgi:hypothetical protein